MVFLHPLPKPPSTQLTPITCFHNYPSVKLLSLTVTTSLPGRRHTLLTGLTASSFASHPPTSTNSFFFSLQPEWFFKVGSHTFSAHNFQWLPISRGIKSKVLTMDCKALHDVTLWVLSCHHPRHSFCLTYLKLLFQLPTILFPKISPCHS